MRGGAGAAASVGADGQGTRSRPLAAASVVIRSIVDQSQFPVVAGPPVLTSPPLMQHPLPTGRPSHCCTRFSRCTAGPLLEAADNADARRRRHSLARHPSRGGRSSSTCSSSPPAHARRSSSLEQSSPTAELESTIISAAGEQGADQAQAMTLQDGIFLHVGLGRWGIPYSAQPVRFISPRSGSSAMMFLRRRWATLSHLGEVQLEQRERCIRDVGGEQSKRPGMSTSPGGSCQLVKINRALLVVRPQ